MSQHHLLYFDALDGRKVVRQLLAGRVVAGQLQEKEAVGGGRVGPDLMEAQARTDDAAVSREDSLHVDRVLEAIGHVYAEDHVFLDRRLGFSCRVEASCSGPGVVGHTMASVKGG